MGGQGAQGVGVTGQPAHDPRRAVGADSRHPAVPVVAVQVDPPLQRGQRLDADGSEALRHLRCQPVGHRVVRPRRGHRHRFQPAQRIELLLDQAQSPLSRPVTGQAGMRLFPQGQQLGLAVHVGRQRGGKFVQREAGRCGSFRQRSAPQQIRHRGAACAPGEGPELIVQRDGHRPDASQVRRAEGEQVAIPQRARVQPLHHAAEKTEVLACQPRADARHCTCSAHFKRWCRHEKGRKSASSY